MVNGATVAISTGQSEGHLGYNNVFSPVKKGECFYISDIGGGDSRSAWYVIVGN